MIEQIIELEGVLKKAAELAGEISAANNAAPNPSPYAPGLASQIAAAADSLVWHQKHLGTKPGLGATVP